MTRLIDADTLKRHYAWWKDDRQKLFDSIVDQQPTVDAIPIKWLTAQADNPSNSDKLRNAIDCIVYTLWAEREEE